MDLDGLTEGPFDFHPGRPILGYFTSGELETLDSCDETSSGLADLARMVLAGIFREFSFWPMEGVPIHQDQATQQAIETIFRVVGQHRPVNRMGPEPEGLQRFPCYGYEHAAGQLRIHPGFIFGLGDHGHPLNDCDRFEDELIDFGRWLNYAMIRVVEHLLTQGPPEYTQRPHIMVSNQLIDEGEMLLRTILNIEGWPSAPVVCQETENLLARFKPEKLGEVMSYHFADQQSIHVHLDRAPEVNAHQLELELRMFSGNIRRGPDYLSVPGVAMYNLMSTYYRKEVVVPEQA